MPEIGLAPKHPSRRLSALIVQTTLGTQHHSAAKTKGKQRNVGPTAVLSIWAPLIPARADYCRIVKLCTQTIKRERKQTDKMRDARREENGEHAPPKHLNLTSACCEQVLECNGCTRLVYSSEPPSVSSFAVTKGIYLTCSSKRAWCICSGSRKRDLS